MTGWMRPVARRWRPGSSKTLRAFAIHRGAEIHSWSHHRPCTAVLEDGRIALSLPPHADVSSAARTKHCAEPSNSQLKVRVYARVPGIVESDAHPPPAR